jgi:hypothetical protein
MPRTKRAQFRGVYKLAWTRRRDQIETLWKFIEALPALEPAFPATRDVRISIYFAKSGVAAIIGLSSDPSGRKFKATSSSAIFDRRGDAVGRQIHRKRPVWGEFPLNFDKRLNEREKQ